jgi:outer membrane protein assembly factor BamB
VFVSLRDQGLRALDARTGALAWRALRRRGRLAAAPGRLYGAEADGTLNAFDPETGALLWTVETGVPGAHGPLMLEEAVALVGRGATLVDRAGAVVWRRPDLPPAAGPAVATDHHLVLPGLDGALRGLDRASGTVTWTRALGPVALTPATAAGGRAFLAAGRRLMCVEAGTGRSRWSRMVGTELSARPALAADLALFVTYEAALYALRRGSGDLVWRALLPSRPLGSPTVHGRVVFVLSHGTRPGESHLTGFDARDGSRLGDLKTPGEAEAEPLVVGENLIVVLKDRRRLLALRMGVSEPAPPPSSPSPEP